MAAGIANPRPPIAGLTNPSGTRAAILACSSGLLDGASSRTTASRDRRWASAERTYADVSGLWAGPEQARRCRTRTRPRVAAGGRRAPRTRRRRARAPRAPRRCGVLRRRRRSRPRPSCRRGGTAPARTCTAGTPRRRQRERRHRAREARAAASCRRADAPRSGDGPAGTRRGRRTTPASPARRASRRSRRRVPGPLLVRARADATAGRSAPAAARRARRLPRGRRRRRATPSPGRWGLPPRAPGPTSRPSARRRGGPTSRRRRVPCAADRAGQVLRPDRLLTERDTCRRGLRGGRRGTARVRDGAGPVARRARRVARG